jgi:hypothetical protein
VPPLEEPPPLDEPPLLDEALPLELPPLEELLLLDDRPPLDELLLLDPPPVPGEPPCGASDSTPQADTTSSAPRARHSALLVDGRVFVTMTPGRPWRCGGSQPRAQGADREEGVRAHPERVT